jgi:WD40 repeat protein
LLGHVDEVRDVDFHPRLDVLCSAGADAEVFVWDANEGSRVCSLPCHLSSVSRAQFLGGFAYDSCIATASDDRLCRLWDIRQRAQVRALPVPGTRCTSFASHSNHHLLAGGTDAGDVEVWDLRTFTSLECFEFGRCEKRAGFEDGIGSLALSPAGDYMAVASAGGEGGVAVVDFEQQQWEVCYNHTSKVSALVWGYDWPYVSEAIPMPFLLCASHDTSWSCSVLAECPEASP